MIHEPLSTRRLFELMRDLQRLATQRSEAQARVVEEYEQGLKQAAAAREAAAGRAESEYQSVKDRAEAEAEAKRGELTAAYEAARSGAQQEYHGLRSAAERDRRQTSEEAEKRLKDEALVILSTFDAQKNEPRRRLDVFIEGLKARQRELAAIRGDAETILRSRTLLPPDTPSEAAPVDADEDSEAGVESSDEAIDKAIDEINESITAARTAAEAIYKQNLGKLIEGPTPYLILLAVTALATLIGWLPSGGQGVVTGAAAASGLLLGGVVIFFIIRPAAMRSGLLAYDQMLKANHAATAQIQAAAAMAQARSRREARELVERRDRDIEALGFEVKQLLGDVRTRTKEELKSASELFPARLQDMRQRYEQDIEQIDSDLRDKLSAVTTTRDEAIAAAKAAEEAGQAKVEQQRQAAWDALRDAWLGGYATVSEALQSIRQRCDRLFPDWGATDYAGWQKPTDVSMGVEFGRAGLDLANVKSGLPEEPELRPERTRFAVPAMITLVEQPAMVITAEGAGRKRAAELMQAVMLHWITCQPPGKVRFTVLDPVGLGESFNSFMHLADYEEGLIATRIWSESRDIEEQLARLTNHMENVLQKYLRSEYESIHEYNASAGEVAEPFQVLVVNGFPTGFGDDTARRLLTLATNGPRCGVYLVMSIDTKQRMPTDFPMDDLLENAAHLDWDAGRGRFVWRYPAFSKLPLELATPPAPERMVEVLKQVGQAAADAVRVEVPFEVVAPAAGKLWTRDCGDELVAPIGRAGANRLQNVRLGKGTSQHLLVAGKTGSGKSTFLHALVTSAAMHYSPDEVEFYLVDFKKGVEFKSYATNELPHARVVAVESEREFGLSVLQRLDEELSRRGELYRASGVQSLADFRAAHPDQPMPRILLVIDEFQELFVEDDKLAQDATLLMDRLVRQGRAFGMHVVLGTQTLAGAYSIARSTLGQIAVRVALACSEADAHLILSDERNTAARFLSRPGEAIYNDQNGLASANELFQVVWLPDRERAQRLADVNDKRQSIGMEAPKMIVFEGNAAADPRENQQLVERLALASDDLEAKAEGGRGKADALSSALRLPPSAFLGDAVAIKPPTAVPFGRHGGANLLVVGQDERSALGMLTVGAVSLVTSSAGARLVVLDASRPGEVSDGVWQKVADALPAEATIAEPKEVPAALATIAAEVARREAESDDAAPAIYVVIHNAGRLRDLRRTEDDFSFSMDNDKPPSPDKQLSEILRSGPGVGVHALVWCDSYNAASRLFDRQAMREFALRVVMQMSAADSSNLIDTPAASNLKPHRSLFYSDETGELEKLRPYGPPTDEWLETLRAGSAVRAAD